jgi:hypothetical protein
VASKGTGSNAKRLTACVSCAMDGTKLPLFYVFKGKTGNRLEKSLPNELPTGTIACCQDNAWMDDVTTVQWVERVWKPYVRENNANKSVLLVDEFRCHMTQKFRTMIADCGTELIIIPGGYTSVLSLLL